MRVDKLTLSTFFVFSAFVLAGFQKTPIFAYVFLLPLIPFFFKVDKADLWLIAGAITVLLVIVWGNVFALNNYLDLTIKGVIKLAFFVALIPSAVEFFRVGMMYRMQSMRLMVWSIFAAGILVEGGIDLQNVQQFLSLFLVAVVEYVNAIMYKNKWGLFVAILLVVITTKKQLILSVLLIPILFGHPIVKKILAIVSIGVVLVALGFGVERDDAEETGRTSEKRIESFLSARFITPDPYGNMRLFLIASVIPKTYEYSPFWGFGLERYGSVAAFESDRDVESSHLGMSKFIGTDYGGDDAGFGAVSADVGVVTIFAQMGVIGLVFYTTLIMYPRKNSFIKTSIILLPFFIGGPLAFSVTFPLLVGVVAASGLLFQQQKISLKGR